MQELQLSNINLAYHERALDFFFQSTALLIIYLCLRTLTPGESLYHSH